MHVVRLVRKCLMASFFAQLGGLTSTDERPIDLVILVV